jgi:phosphomannomutase
VARTAESVNAVIKAYDVRGVVGEQIDEAFVRDVGASFARLVRDEEGAARTVVVGHDMRDSSPGLSRAFADGVTAQGLDVVHIGLASTDQLYFASGLLECPGAMFTASHNPAKYNGIKLCRAGAKPVGQDTGLATIKSELIDGVPDFDGPAGTATSRDVLTDYAGFVRDLVDLSGIGSMKIAVDAGNGMGGHTVPAVFAPLPVTIEPLFFELDGSFPNHEANPLDPANLVDLQRFVVETGADIGLAFDGDADRCFIVDERGEIVSPSVLTALIASRELAREPGSSVIHNLITSRAVPELVTELGGKPVRTRVGHSFIKATMAETDAIFGGEHSGHFYFRDFWRADSGMLAALHVLAALAETDRPLSELLAEFSRYVATGEINSTVADQAGVLAEIEREYGSREGVTLDHLDGLTVTHDDWWFNVRPSNTEPLLRLNAEAGDRATLDRLRDDVLATIRRDS